MVFNSFSRDINLGKYIYSTFTVELEQLPVLLLDLLQPQGQHDLS